MILETFGKLKVAHGHFMGYAVGGFGVTNLDALMEMFAQCDYLSKLLTPQQ